MPCRPSRLPGSRARALDAIDLYASDAKIAYYGPLPHATLALRVQALFGLAERWIVPRGLRIKRTAAQ